MRSSLCGRKTKWNYLAHVHRGPEEGFRFRGPPTHHGNGHRPGWGRMWKVTPPRVTASNVNLEDMAQVGWLHQDALWEYRYRVLITWQPNLLAAGVYPAPITSTVLLCLSLCQQYLIWLIRELQMITFLTVIHLDEIPMPQYCVANNKEFVLKYPEF